MATDHSSLRNGKVLLVILNSLRQRRVFSRGRESTVARRPYAPTSCSLAGANPAREEGRFSARPPRPRPAVLGPPPPSHWLRCSTHHAGDPGVPSRRGGTLGGRGGARAQAQRSESVSGRGRKGWCSRFPGLPEGAGVRARAGRAAVATRTLAPVRVRGGPQS